MTTAYNFRLDGVSPGVAIKRPCRVATTANITLSGLQTIDGITLVQDDRVLVKNQTDAKQNGIYFATTSAWQRTKDFDGEFDVVKGTVVLVMEGSANGNTAWKLDTQDPVTFGVTSLTFSQNSFTFGDIGNSVVTSTGSTTARSLAARFSRPLSVFDYGAIGDGVAHPLSERYASLAAAQVDYPHATALTDQIDWAAIQKTVDVAEAAAREVTGGGGVFGYDPAVDLVNGHFIINREITLDDQYTKIVGDNAILAKATGTFTGDAAIDAPLVTSSGWRTQLRGIQFSGFANAVRLDSGNSDAGFVIIDDCKFFDITDMAVRIIGPSTKAILRDCMWRNCVHELRAGLDNCELSGAWITRGVLTAADDGGIINDGGIMRINNMTGIPVVQTAARPAWIVNEPGGSVYVHQSRFGGEAGQTCAINNKAPLDANDPFVPIHVCIRDCDVFTGSDVPTVRLYELPNHLILDGNHGMSGTRWVDWSSTVSGPDQTTKIGTIPSDAINRRKFFISVNKSGVNLPATGNVIPVNLFKWVDEWQGTFTPTFAASGTAYTSVTYRSTVRGVWRKIRNLVWIHLSLGTTAVTVGPATGNLVIDGLPFTVRTQHAGLDDASAAMSIGWADNWTATRAPEGAHVIPNTTRIALYYRTAVSGNLIQHAASDINTGGGNNDLYITGWYEIEGT